MSNSPQANPQLMQQIAAAANQLSPQEASQRYQQIMAQLPPDVAAQLNAVAFSQLPPDERRQVASQLRQANDDPSRPFDGFAYADEEEGAQPMSLGRMTKQARDQDPDLIQGLLGGNSGLGGQLGKMALAALAYMLIQRMMGDQANSRGMPGGMLGGAGPLGGLLGGLLGGIAGGLGGAGSMGGADPIGSILGGLLGGGSMPQSQADNMGRSIGDYLGSGQGHTPQRGGNDMGDLLGSLLGGGGGQTGGDLGSLLGALMGAAGGSRGLTQQRDDPDDGSGLHVRGSQRS
ncbi:MAG: hypothetical protein RLZZ387_3763 [Chloroflexota bacterium]